MNRSLSSSRVALKRQLDEQSVRERTSENKFMTSSKSKDGKIAELEKTIETLRAEKDDHHVSRAECDEKLTEAEGALRAEAIRAERYKKKVDSARAAEHNQKMALGKCEQALERALESAGQSDADAHRFSESVAAVAADDDDWDEDLITDIVHPSHRYDRAPRQGTSHHLAADEAEMHGLEDDAAAAMDAEEKLLTNARDPAMEYPDDLTDAEPAEPVPPKKRKVEIEKKSKSKSPPPQKVKKPPAPPPARSRNGRKLPPGRAPPATASELQKNRQKARQSLFASAEMR